MPTFQPPGADPSIVVHEAERELLHPDLDFRYITQAASEIAATLAPGEPFAGVAECCYQPGDGTRYPLVFVPLALLVPTRGRIADGREWERNACAGMFNRDDDAAALAEAAERGILAAPHRTYVANGYLVVRVEGAAYPLALGGRSSLVGADYVAEHWNARGSSALTLAILFRAIGYHLDAITHLRAAAG